MRFEAITGDKESTFLPIEKKLEDGLITITKQIFTRDFKPKITNKKDPNKSLRLYHKCLSPQRLKISLLSARLQTQTSQYASF